MEKKQVLIDFLKWYDPTLKYNSIGSFEGLVEEYLKSINTEFEDIDEEKKICSSCKHYIDDFPIEGCNISNWSKCKGKFYELKE